MKKGEKMSQLQKNKTTTKKQTNTNYNCENLVTMYVNILTGSFFFYLRFFGITIPLKYQMFLSYFFGNALELTN